MRDSETIIQQLKNENVALKKRLEQIEKQIVECRETEVKLRLGEENLRITLESIGDAVIATDGNSVVTEINPVAQRLTGWVKSKAVGRKLSDVFVIVNSKTNKLVENPVEAVLRTGNIVGLANHTKLISKDGSEYHISDSGSPIRNKSGDIVGVVLVFRDITKEYLMQEELLDSETRYRAVFENTGTATVIVETDGKITLANSQFAKLCGYSLDEIINKTAWMDFVVPEDLKRMMEQHKLRRKNPEDALTNYEFRLIDKESQIKNVFLQVDVIPGTGKSVASLRDITSEKLVERALVDSEKKYRLLVENQSDMVVKLDLHGNFLFASPSFCRKFNQSENDLLDESFTSMVFAEDRLSVESEMNRLLNGPYASYFEMRALTSEGLKWFAWQMTAVLNNDGFIEEIIAVGRDVNDRKQAELHIREQERLLASMISNLPGFVYRCDLDKAWTMRIISEQCLQITGYKSSDFINNNRLAYNDIITSEFQKKVSDGWEKAIREKIVYEGEYQVITKNRELRWLWERGRGVFDEKGEVRFLEGYVVDVTDNKHLIRDLTNAKEKAEESDRLKTAFLANMSHEIRTPMNGILGFTDLLLEPKLTGEQITEYVEVIQRSGNRMLNTVNDIITISKIETGQETISPEDLNLKTEIGDICKMLTHEALSKGILLVFENEGISGVDIVNADKVKFVSVLTNLLKNAIKFTDSGFVKTGYVKRGAYYEFFVKDSGIGIPAERQKAIFERFIQGDLDDVKALQGSGLGLSIAKSYVEMMGGEIWLKSEENIGTEFYFTIPFTQKKSMVRVENHRNADASSKLNVLVVEDDYASIKYLNVILHDVVAKMVVVRDGREAVDQVKRQKDFDLILMDIKLPFMNGYEATSKIREFNKDVVIIAQTAYAIVGDKEKAIKAGCDDYITKPIVKAKLLKMIHQHVGNPILKK